MTDCTRRVFMIAAGPACAAAGTALAAVKKVEKSEPKAVAVGYRHDTTQVDKAASQVPARAELRQRPHLYAGQKGGRLRP